MGCDKIAPECAHCYIGRELRKQHRRPWGELYLTKTWREPYKWNHRLNCFKRPGQLGYPAPEQRTCKRIFTCSLSDFFHAKADNRYFGVGSIEPFEKWDMLPQYRLPAVAAWENDSTIEPTWRNTVWRVIRDTPNLIYLILTKRPELIPARLPKDWGEGYPNVWLGTSVGCRTTLSKIDSLRKVPVHRKAVRFLSCEPLLENIAWDVDLSGIGWVIVGGESGTNPERRWNPQGDWRKELQNDRGRRTMEIGWAKDLRMKCEAQVIPFWFKQITAGCSGTGEDALGEIVHEVPSPPYGEWAATEESKLVVLGWQRRLLIQRICKGGHE